jgi:hypothetical protein
MDLDQDHQLQSTAVDQAIENEVTRTCTGAASDEEGLAMYSL